MEIKGWKKIKIKKQKLDTKVQWKKKKKKHVYHIKWKLIQDKFSSLHIKNIYYAEKY